MNCFYCKFYDRQGICASCFNRTFNPKHIVKFEHIHDVKVLRFTENMFRKVIDGNKTQTRRPVKHTNVSKYNIGDIVYLEDPYIFYDSFSSDSFGNKITTMNYLYKTDLISEEDRNKICWLTTDNCPPAYKNYRYKVKITNVKKEYLQDISSEDIVKECCYISDVAPEKQYFKELWNDIYKDEPQYKWEENPMVWVYDFELIK